MRNIVLMMIVSRQKYEISIPNDYKLCNNNQEQQQRVFRWNKTP